MRVPVLLFLNEPQPLPEKGFNRIPMQVDDSQNNHWGLTTGTLV